LFTVAALRPASRRLAPQRAASQRLYQLEKPMTNFASANPENEIKIDHIVRKLRALGINEILPYSAINEIVGADHRSRQWLMMRARRIVETAEGFRFGTVVKIGIKRLSADDIAGIGADARRAIGSRARRASARLTNLKGYNIAPEVQAGIDLERSLLAAINIMTHERTRIKAADMGQQTGPVLPEALFRQMSG